MIYKSVLSGYVLEELLASLIAGSGYKLLVDKNQDLDSLVKQGNGLCVHGRGANHQADVLGELAVPVQLSYPLRLFVEAKCRGGKTGLPDVRNAVGTIDDVNDSWTWDIAKGWKNPYKRYRYQYALASTSGFSDEAVRYAITHQLSLIDLSTTSAQWLRDAVSRITTELLKLSQNGKLTHFPTNQMREAMRKALGTWPGMPAADENDLAQAAARAATAKTGPRGLDVDKLADICASAKDTLESRLYVAWTNTPILLFVMPDDPPAAVVALAEQSRLVSRLVFTGPDLTYGEWALDPDNRSTSRPSATRQARMRFTVPPQMEPFIFGTLAAEGQVEAEEVSSGLRTINIQTRPGHVSELLFEPVPIDRPTNPLRTEQPSEDDRGIEIDYDEPDAEPNDWMSLRERAWTHRRELAATSASESPATEDDDRVEWSEQAFRLLLGRLRDEGQIQADIIEAAARAGGEVTRAQVYDLAEFPAHRTLRGFTRPAARISQDLVEEDFVDELADWPLWAVYRTGVRASHFGVPPEFARFVD